MTRMSGMAVLVVLAGLLSCGVAGAAQNRLALVIGNGGYSSLGPLANTLSDARLMEETLRASGFETTLATELDTASMRRTIAAFGRKLDMAGADAVGLFYFAGHGVQAEGRSYLMPVDAAPADVIELEIVGVEVDWVMRLFERSGTKTNIVILDACRNNPFASESRSASRGLARVSAPTGSFIAYATAPGGVADDGDGANSPFTSALARAIAEPGKTIEQVFKKVRVDVLEATGGRQTPWDSSSLVSDFYFTNEAPADRSAASPAEVTLWRKVSESGDPGRIALFLQVFPESPYAEEAKELLAASLSGDDGSVAAAPEPKPEPSVEVAVAAPPPSEEEMIEAARIAGTEEGYRAYLTAYPQGVFADLAKMELAALGASAPAPSAAAAGPLTFSAPLVSQNPELSGKSIEQLIAGTPSYPPIEGLSEALWKDQSCAFCHNWSRTALCAQGEHYRKSEAASPGRIKHPYGGGFKGAVAAWADAGCN